MLAAAAFNFKKWMREVQIFFATVFNIIFTENNCLA